MNVTAAEMRHVLPLEEQARAEDYEDKESITVVVKSYMAAWDSVNDDGVDSDRIEELWRQTSLDAIQVQDAVQELKRKGEVYELQTEVYSLT